MTCYYELWLWFALILQYNDTVPSSLVEYICCIFLRRLYKSEAICSLTELVFYFYLQCLSQLKTLYADGIEGCSLEFAAYSLLYITLHSNNNRELLSSMSRLVLIDFHVWAPPKHVVRKIFRNKSLGKIRIRNCYTNSVSDQLGIVLELYMFTPPI